MGCHRQDGGQLRGPLCSRGLGPGTSFQHLSAQMLLRGTEEVGMLGPREARGQRALPAVGALGVLEQVGPFPEWTAFQLIIATSPRAQENVVSGVPRACLLMPRKTRVLCLLN